MPKTTKIPGKLSQTLRVEHVLVDISRKYTRALSKYESEEGKLEVFSPFTNEELYKYIDIKSKESFLRAIKTEGVALTSTQKLDLSDILKESYISSKIVNKGELFYLTLQEFYRLVGREEYNFVCNYQDIIEGLYVDYRPCKDDKEVGVVISRKRGKDKYYPSIKENIEFLYEYKNLPLEITIDKVIREKNIKVLKNKFKHLELIDKTEQGNSIINRYSTATKTALALKEILEK